jgi:hypothetical protein
MYLFLPFHRLLPFHCFFAFDLARHIMHNIQVKQSVQLPETLLLGVLHRPIRLQNHQYDFHLFQRVELQLQQMHAHMQLLASLWLHNLLLSSIHLRRPN